MEKNDKTMVKKNIVHIRGGGAEGGGGFWGRLDLIHQNVFFYETSRRELEEEEKIMDLIHMDIFFLSTESNLTWTSPSNKKALNQSWSMFLLLLLFLLSCMLQKYRKYPNMETVSK